MPILTKLSLLLLIAGGVPLAVYGLIFGYLVWAAPVSYAELDLDADGRVTLAELESARALGERPVAVGE